MTQLKAMSEDKMEIKIRIKIKDVEIELSRDDLQELRKILDDLFSRRHDMPRYPTLPWYPIVPWGTARWTVSNGDGTNALPENIIICHAGKSD